MGTKKIIDQKKHSHDELLQLEDKFYKIFQLCPDLIGVTRIKDGVFVEVNKSFIDHVGYTAEELIGHSSMPGDLGLWVNLEDRQKLIKLSRKEGVATGIEALFRRKDGSTFCGLISSKIIEIKGEPYLISLIRDITERKFFLEEITNSRAQYKLVFDNLINGFALHEIVLDDSLRPVDYVFLEVNSAFEKMTGLKRDKIIGRKVSEVLPGVQNDPADWIGKYGAVAAGGGELRIENYSVALNKWFSVVVFSPKKGQFVTITEDITERKRVDEKLRESEIRFREFFATSRDCVFITTQSGKWIDFNDAAVEMFGYDSREELFYVPISSLYLNPSERSKVLDAIVKQGYVQEYPVQLKRKDGVILDVLITAEDRMSADGTNKEYFGTIRNITARKQAEDTLKAKTALLEAQANATSEGILVIDENNKRVFINQRMIALFNVPADILANEDDTALLDFVMNLTKFPEQFIEKVAYLYKRPEQISNDEVEFKSGMILERYSAPVWGKDGKNYGRIWTFRDITERKLAEKSLQESEKKLSEAQSMAQMGYWDWDVQTGSVKWSEEVFNIFRLDPKKFIPQIDSIMAFSPWPEDHQRNQELVRWALQSHEKGTYEQRFFRGDKSVGYYQSTFHGRYDEKGNLVSIVGTVMDITERKLAENRIKENEDFLNAIIENIPNMIFVKDAKDLKYLRFNQAGEKLLGYSAKMLLGKNDLDFFPKEQAEFFMAKDRDALSKKECIDVPEENIRIKSGEEKVLHTKKIPMLDEYGNPAYLLGISEDITERKRLDAALHNAEMRFRLLFELSPEGIVIIDPQTANILEFNSTAHQQLGYSREEFSKLNITDIEVKETAQAIRERIAKVLKGERQDFATQQRCRNGQVKDIYVTAQIIEILGHPVYYCIWRDITELKKNEEESAKRARELEVFYKASLGREERIIELKQEVERLRQQLKLNQ